MLKHDWFMKYGSTDDSRCDKLDPEVFQRMRDYRSTSYFERAAMNILVKMSSDQNLKEMTRQFRKLDLDGTGLIHAHEIKQYITENNVMISDREVDELIREIDYAGNGKINYSEFLAATIDCKQFFDDQKFRVVFSMFDLEGNN